jgi:hypothetical protein
LWPFDFAERFLLGFLLKIVRIVPAEILHRSAIDLEDAVRDAVEKISIVCDEQQHAGVAAEIIFEPLDGVGVEMVCRLVEDQDVGFENELVCECDAAFAGRRRALPSLQTCRGSRVL